MSEDSPIARRIFRSLPPSMKKHIDEFMCRSNYFLLHKFYWGKGNILRKKGWFKSEKEGAPVDGEGEPIPWYPYAIIDFLEIRVSENHRVFEYGSGHSTIWYAERADIVISVEHSAKWVSKLRPRLPPNSKVVHRPLGDEYIKEITYHHDFDIIVIDGEHRSECIQPALSSISSDGIVIWDDIEQIDEENREKLRNNGFQEITFHGLKPHVSEYKATSIFYRDDNCIGI